MKEKKSEWFGMRLDPKTRHKLVRLAEESGLSQAAVICTLINNTSNIRIGPMVQTKAKITNDI